jgi:L-ascorbate metabolism protein UlaG (beta-lactamase superfamily)
MYNRLSWLVAKLVFAVVFSLVLASCASQRDKALSVKKIGEEKAGIFQNALGHRHSPPQINDTLNYLVKLYTLRFPGRQSLPENHVLDPALSAKQLQDSRNFPYALTWFGHSTFLIKMGKLNILTDPVLGDSVGPFPLKLRRMVPVLPRWQDIDHLDVIVISHGDYDHMDEATLRKLVRKFPDVQIVVPQGAHKHLSTLRAHKIIELAWYQSLKMGQLKLTSVPAVHSTQRPPHQTDSAHWAGFVFKHRNRALYFSGDTGPGKLFKEIRRRIGRVDVAIVPTGAYAPQDYEKHFHVTPEAAVAIAETMGASLAVGMHWGTFSLSEETPVEQKRRFLAAARKTTATTLFRVGESRKLF